MYRFVVKKNYVNLLLGMGTGKYRIKDCAKISGMEYTHLTQVFNFFVSEGLMSRERSGSGYDMCLTEYGQKVVNCLGELKKVIDDHEMEVKNGIKR